MKKKLYIPIAIIAGLLVIAGVIIALIATQPGESVTVVTEDESGDFILTVSVENTRVRRGEPFIVNVELKNNSGEDYEITYFFLFWPHIEGWHIADDWGFMRAAPPGEPQTRLFEADSIIRNTEFRDWESYAGEIGTTLERGTHELRFGAYFHLNWRHENEREISFLSNPITLRVR